MELESMEMEDLEDEYCENFVELGLPKCECGQPLGLQSLMGSSNPDLVWVCLDRTCQKEYSQKFINETEWGYRNRQLLSNFFIEVQFRNHVI